MSLVRPRDRIAVVRSGTRAFRSLSRRILRTCGVRVVVEGPPPPPGPCVVCANHVSWLDVLVLASVADAVFVSRGEVAGWPVVGSLSRLAGTVFLDRSRRRDATRAGDVLGDLLDRGLRVAFFPEGRAGTGETLLPFRPALFEPACRRGTPCVAATLRYVVPGDEDGCVAREVVSWAGDAPFGAHVMGVLRRRRIEAHVRFHPPRSGPERKALCAALERDAASGLPTSLQPAR